MADTGQQARPLLQTKTLAGAYSALQLKAVQLEGKGSHGKNKLLNVQGTYTVCGVATVFNDRGENVKDHGGYEDEDALGED